jgi:REP element-mobilizing transposase RayT
LLKFSKDKKRWEYWLLEAKRRFKLVVLNYTVTSNHIHLLVYCNDSNVIPQAVQLIAGRTAQEFNNRRNRKGAFWQDRYHATAVESRKHLMECIVYDLGVRLSLLWLLLLSCGKGTDDDIVRDQNLTPGDII